MAFHSFTADAEFFRDLTGAVHSRDACEHLHLAIAEKIETVCNTAMTGKFVHRKRRNHWADINFICQHRLDRSQ